MQALPPLEHLNAVCDGTDAPDFLGAQLLTSETRPLANQLLHAAAADSTTPKAPAAIQKAIRNVVVSKKKPKTVGEYLAMVLSEKVEL